MTKIRRQRILVTGAGGFIGSHLVERLIQDDCSVRGFIKYNSRSELGLLRFLPTDVLNRVEIFAGDLKDPYAVLRAVEGIDLIFHLGALIAIPYSYLNPTDVVQTNVSGTMNILEAARKQNVRRVIHTSTSEVYGTAQYIPIDEAHPLQGQSPYSASKIGADKLVESYYRSYNLPVVTVRPFNTYGPRQSARAIIPTIIVQALTMNVVRVGSLEPIRDFNYVSDTVNGLMLAAQSDAVIGQVINLGTGKEISIGDLLEKIITIIGDEKEIEVLSQAERIRPIISEVMRLVADTTKAKDLLKWQPQISLDTGLQRTIHWIQNNLDLYRKVDEYVV